MSLTAASVLLRNTALFRPLQEADFEALCSVLRERRLRRGEVVCQQGAPGDSMVIVGEGRLQVEVGAPEGTAVREIGPGEVSGEMSCIDPAPRSATVTALSDGRVFELDQTMFRSLQQHAPLVAVVIVGGIIGQLTERLRDTIARIEKELYQHQKTSVSAFMPRVTEPEVVYMPQPAPHRGPLDLGSLRSVRGLSERDLEILSSVAPAMLHPDGAMLCIEGRPGSSCFLLAQGALEVIKRFGATQRVLATLQPGALIGQLALVDQTARSASVRVRGSAVVMQLGRDDFDKLLQARSPLAIRFQEQVAVAGIRQLRQATERLAAILRQAAPGPVAVAAARGATPPPAEAPQEVTMTVPVPMPPPVPTPVPMPTPSRPVVLRPAPIPANVTKALSYVQVALREWEVSADDVDNVVTTGVRVKEE